MREMPARAAAEASDPPAERPGGGARQPNTPDGWGPAPLSMRFWSVAVLTGIGAGLGAIVLMAVLRLCQHLAFGDVGGPFQDAVARSSDIRRVLVLAGAGLFGGVAWWLLRRHERPGSGAGLSEAVWEHEGQMPFARTLLNALLQMAVVGFGASLGREGAPKEAGAALASRLSNLARLPPDQRRLLVACGAGAGMAAVYNVPLGGALFAIEVLLGTLTLPLVLPALVVSALATLVSWLGLPHTPTYAVPAYHLHASQVIWALWFGPLAGLLAVGYIRLMALAKGRRVRGPWAILATTAVFAGLGALAILYPQLLGNGKDIAALALVGSVGLVLSGVLAVLKPLATAACFGGGATGGLFTPTMAFGALIGLFLGHLWSLAWPGAPLGSFAFLGAGAMLAAAMEAPICACVLVLELTGRGVPIMVPLLVAVALATVVGRLLDNRSIFSAPLPRHEGAAHRLPNRRILAVPPAWRSRAGRPAARRETSGDRTPPATGPTT